jgi:hypothetical protein
MVKHSNVQPDLATSAPMIRIQVIRFTPPPRRPTAAKRITGSYAHQETAESLGKVGNFLCTGTLVMVKVIGTSIAANICLLPDTPRDEYNQKVRCCEDAMSPFSDRSARRGVRKRIDAFDMFRRR